MCVAAYGGRVASAPSEVGQLTPAPRLRDLKARTMAAVALLIACAGFALGNGTAAVTSSDPDVKALDARVSALEADNARLNDVVDCMAVSDRRYVRERIEHSRRLYRLHLLLWDPRCR
jgi:hypothetical protein